MIWLQDALDVVLGLECCLPVCKHEIKRLSRHLVRVDPSCETQIRHMTKTKQLRQMFKKINSSMHSEKRKLIDNFVLRANLMFRQNWPFSVCELEEDMKLSGVYASSQHIQARLIGHWDVRRWKLRQWSSDEKLEYLCDPSLILRHRPWELYSWDV